MSGACYRGTLGLPMHALAACRLSLAAFTYSPWLRYSVASRYIKVRVAGRYWVSPAKLDDLASDLGPSYPTVANPESVSHWEREFYEALYETGIRPVPQVPVEKYVLDFKDDSRSLDIEVDSELYHRNWDGDHTLRDQPPTQRMIELGWDVMRFWVYQLQDDLAIARDRITRGYNEIECRTYGIDPCPTIGDVRTGG